MVPLDTNSLITVWITLRPIHAKGDSGLVFAGGSHRDMALPFWHADLDKDLSSRGYRTADAGKP